MAFISAWRNGYEKTGNGNERGSFYIMMRTLTTYRLMYVSLTRTAHAQNTHSERRTMVPRFRLTASER